jgi:glycine betaine/proline transport system ATP-binding protein
MRDPDAAGGDAVPVDGPVLKADQIVRDAARVVLDHHGPCRVVDGDKVVGVVDDEDILRVVVAEEDAS